MSGPIGLSPHRDPESGGALAPAVPARHRPLGTARAGARGAVSLARRHPRSAAFAAYTALALLSAGWHPLGDPARVCACSVNTDPSAFMWALAWWPHALLNGLNPFYAHAVWAPAGVNVARSATIPAAALALAPVTALAGPIVAYNVLVIASPALSAFTAYLLCRRVARRQAPALVGGFIFGFGPYQFAQLVAHPNLTLVFLVPAMAHLALRRAEGEISARAYVAAMAGALIVQAGLSTEVLATSLMLGGVALLAARLLAPAPYPERIDRLMGETLGAGCVAALLLSPLLYYALVKGGAPQEWPWISDQYGLDALNPLIPTAVTWLGHHDFQALSATFNGGNPAEADGYLSIPLLAAFFLWQARTRRRVIARILLCVFTVSLLAALGSHLHIAGVQTVTLPYQLLREWPIFHLITPARLVMFAALALAVGVAAWLAETAGRRLLGRWLLVALGAVMIFPNVTGGFWSGSPHNPAFFRDAIYRRYMARGETALLLPFGQAGQDMLWQAETGFYFRMPEGYTGHLNPPSFEAQAIVHELNLGEQGKPAALAAFLRRYGVRDVIVDAKDPGVVGYISTLSQLGLRGTPVGGVILYRVGGT